MQQIVTDLFDLVSDSLYEMTWHRDLPVQPNIALHCFIGAFGAHGAEAEIDKNEVRLTLAEEIAGKTYVVRTDMTFEDILTAGAGTRVAHHTPYTKQSTRHMTEWARYLKQTGKSAAGLT